LEGGFVWRRIDDAPLPPAVSAFRPIPPCLADAMVRDGRAGVLLPPRPRDSELLALLPAEHHGPVGPVVPVGGRPPHGRR
jgi:hypothetical protein